MSVQLIVEAKLNLVFNEQSGQFLARVCPQLRRYSAGERPKCRLNALESWLWSAYPDSRAASASERLELVKSDFAFSTRHQRRYSPGVQWKNRRKVRTKCTGWTPISRAASATPKV